MDAEAWENPWLYIHREELAALRAERARLLRELAEVRAQHRELLAAHGEG